MSISINLNSEAECRRAYVNYYYQGNTLNIDSKDMGKILATYSDKLAYWQSLATLDENSYEIDDGDYQSATQSGRSKAQDVTGYSGGKGNMIGRGVGDATWSLGTAAVSLGAVECLDEAVTTGLNETIGKLGAQTVTNKANGGQNTTKASWIIAAPMALATGVAYAAKKPNKDQKEATDQLKEKVMPDAMGNLQDKQADMDKMANDVTKLSDDATQANDKANDDIVNKKVKFDTYKAIFEVLKAKVEAGEPLTEDEKTLYESTVKYMQENAEGITTIKDETSEAVNGIYDDIEKHQDKYDTVAESIGEVEGITDFAEGFDSATRKMCFVEGFAQSLNALSGGKASYQAAAFALSGSAFFGATSWAWLFAAMGATGAALSTAGSIEQFTWASKVGDEIHLREDTQNFNTETLDIYNEEIDHFAVTMETVEGLEVDIPKNMELPENVPTPTVTGNGLPNGTPDAIKPRNDDEDDKDKK